MVESPSRAKCRWWVRPMLLDRSRYGHFHNLFKFMRTNDNEQFSIYTRMTVQQFEKLHNLVKVRLTKSSHRRPLSSEHRLVITIYYLAHGGSMQLTAWSFYVSKSTVSSIIRETCQVIWVVLSKIYLQSLTTEVWENKAMEFNQRWNLPDCIGAMDGKHMIQCPKKSGSQYFNYKKTFSIVLMAICDANYSFTLVDIGAFGSQSDGGVLKVSAFGQAMNNNELRIPRDKSLPGTDTSFPYFVAADEAFPLKRYIMRPYPGTKLTQKQQIFNYRLSRGRRVVENTFGILARQWRIFLTNIIAEVSTIQKIVCAAICLPNFLKKEDPVIQPRYCPRNYVDTYDEEGNVLAGEWRRNHESQMHDLGRTGSNHYARSVENVRATLADYLVSTGGEVEWQYSHVNRGNF